MRLIVALLALTLAVLAGPAAAQTRIADPKAFITEVYGKLDAKSGSDNDYEPPSDIWTAPMARAWADEEKERRGDLGRLDFYFWVNGQDWDLSGIEINERTVWRRPDRRVVLASFSNFGQENLLEFYFQKVGDRWLIDDVSSIDMVEGEEGSFWTLSLILKYAREEEVAE